MGTYMGEISSLGDYTVVATTIVREDAQGHETVGAFDQQKERFIDGLVIGNKRFGRLSCSSNLYPHFEADKNAVLYTWIHPFLGRPPLRTGIIGIVYPNDDRAYIISGAQLLLSLMTLALLPLLWLIPGLVLGSLLNMMLGLSERATAWAMVLIMFSPWIAGGIMTFNYVRMKAKHPRATVPR